MVTRPVFRSGQRDTEDVFEDKQMAGGAVPPGFPVDDGAAADPGAGGELSLGEVEDLPPSGDPGSEVCAHAAIVTTQLYSSQHG